MEWISVKDRLPDRDGTYLVATKNQAVMATYFYASDGHKCFSSQNINRLVTHWMPLPEPPEEPELQINNEWVGHIRQRFERVE